MPESIEVWLGDSPKIEGTDEHELPGFGDPVVRAAESFQRAHPDYEVRIRKIDFRALPGAVAEAVAAGTPPDLAEYVYTATQLGLDTVDRDGKPLFVPVDRAVAGRTEILGEPVVTTDLLPAVRDYWSRAGELVSVPTSVTSNILYGNRAILERAGVRSMPATWQELTTACEAVAALPDGPSHGVSWPNYGWFFHVEIAGQGGTLANADNGRTGRADTVYLDSPEMLAYVSWWKSMHDAGHYFYTGELNDFFGGMQAFFRQEVAFTITSSAVGDDIEQMATAAGIELLAGHPPRFDEQPYSGGPFGGQSFFLAAGLPKAREDGALAFLQHQLNPEHATARLRERSLPMTTAAYKATVAEGWEDPFPGFRVAAEQVASPNLVPAAAGPLLGNLNGVNGATIGAMADVLMHGADPATRFRAATAEAQALLDRHNAAALASPPRNPDEWWITA